MLAELGSILTGLALAAALYAAFAVIWSIRVSDPRWARSGYNGIYAASGLLGLALLALLASFLADDFQVQYVAQHSSRDLPLSLKFSAVWAGQEGSLLLWAFLQALFAALVVARPSERTKPLVKWAAVFLSVITVFFSAVTLFLSNPFVLSPRVPADGLGLNPLLRHPGMIFHPPALYLGYVGLAVPFAFALAALATRQVDRWPAAARRWTLAAWLFLGIGLMLGARWAYDVLGWGGYWGWDPVENAGLMPWLTATALLHSTVMQDERRGFRVWNVVLAVLSFALVLFGTFTTRSGLIESVHAFARSNLGPYFLAAIALTLGGSLAMMLSRRAELADSRSSEGLLSRDGMFFLTLVLLLAITASVFIGSVLPTITEAFAGQKFEAGPEWFDRVIGPQFAALVLVMGLCPLLGRAIAAVRRLRQRGLIALAGGAAVAGAAALAGFTQPISLAAFAVVGLAGAANLAEYFRDVLARVRRGGEGVVQVLVSLVARNRRKYGGYLVHIGVVLMALGVVGTRMYAIEDEVVLMPGEPTSVGEYTLLFEGLKQEPGADRLTTFAPVSAYRNGAFLGALRPQMNQYASYEQNVAEPAIRPGLRQDLYLVLAGWEGGESGATLKVFVNPLASFLWLGGLVFLVGGAVAVWPSAATARIGAPAARRRAIRNAVSGGVVVLVLVAAAVAMWGAGGLAAAQSRGRPLPGEQARDFTLGLLDGSSVTLSEMRGEVVLINFWASWCPPCEDEMPALQAIWEEFEAQGVTVLGVAYDDTEADAREMITQFGLSYPVGLDAGDRISSDYGITGVPETFLVDQNGQVAYVHIGPVTAEQLRDNLAGLLPE
jgi:cytochrome c-type biogenesis protein CcmF